MRGVLVLADPAAPYSDVSDALNAINDAGLKPSFPAGKR
jgi:hypothetical protein